VGELLGLYRMLQINNTYNINMGTLEVQVLPTTPLVGLNKVKIRH